MKDKKKDGVLTRAFKLPYRYLARSTQADRSYLMQRIDSVKAIANLTRREVEGAGKTKEPLATDKKDYCVRYRNARLVSFFGLSGVVFSAYIMMTATSLEMLAISLLSFGGLCVIYLRLIMALLKARLFYANFENIEYRKSLTFTVSDFVNLSAQKPSVLLPLPIDSQEVKI